MNNNLGNKNGSWYIEWDENKEPPFEAIFEELNWLKSHTAPKAEEPHRSAEEILKPYIKNATTGFGTYLIVDEAKALLAMHEYANQFKQSDK